jgi:hypothetical protein
VIALRARFAVLILLTLLPAGLRGDEPPFREKGAIYLEDILSKPVKVDVATEAPIYFDSDMGRYLGILKKGQLVELQAITDTMFRVKGMAQQGQVVGWVDPKYLGALKPDFLANLRKAAKRQDEVKALIARKQVAINMTPQEVTASLGKAPKTTSRIDASGQHEVWEYINYEDVPQQSTGYDHYGNLVSSTVMVRVPDGTMSVIFDNNLVTAIEQTKGNLASGNQTRILATPIEVY